MSDEVFVQVDNKNGGRMSLVFGISGVVMVASAFLVIGKFSERLDRVERDILTKATANEINITTSSINDKLLLLTTQITQIQITLQNNTRPNVMRRD